MGERPLLGFGEAMPLLHMRANRNPRFALGAMGGRFVLACTVFDVTHADSRAALGALEAADFHDGARIAVLFLSDPAGMDDPLAAKIGAKKVVLYDGEREALELMGLASAASDKGGRLVLFDPSLRVIAGWPLSQITTALEALAGMPEPSAHAGVPLHAPVLIAPRVFEPAFCKLLIDYYGKNGGAASGTTRENEAGKTYIALDPDFKKRSDCIIEDQNLREAAMHRIYWRLGPQIEKAFAFKPTRMERYIIACYDAESGGYFKAHRDNTTKGTAHRRFAVTINLNAEDYDGGDLCFPEYGYRTYRAPTGGAVVFSCSLLHEASPVTRAKRYAFLPFLYDEAAAQIRAANNAHLDDSIGEYRA